MKALDKNNLTANDIQKEVAKRLRKYARRNAHERYAIFMGTAQLLELSLKHLLVNRYGHEFEKIARWTLGSTANTLKTHGVRADFITLLQSVVKYRNYIAHEMLANDALIKSLTGGKSGRLELRQLDKGIYELEQICFLHDWCIKHDAWA